MVIQFLFAIKSVGRHIARRNLRFCSDSLESANSKTSVRKKVATLRSMGVFYPLDMPAIGVSKWLLYTLTELSVARFDGWVMQNLKLWSGQ